jgi:NAD(P)H-flavin reductase/hemoglobin-like flavoprotein
MDTARLRASWSLVARHGAEVPGFFYAHLFLSRPQLREMFPVSMAAQQDRLVGALGRIVSNVDKVEAVVPYVEQLGRDHRKFAVRPEHFPMVGASLLATLEYFLGRDWTPQLAADWAEAYNLVSEVMVGAAEKAETSAPPWWDAEVLDHERRGLDVAVLRIRPQPHHPYRPGQSVALQTSLRPRVWRRYSPANAPRPDGTIDLHVKAVPGGQVSNALVNSVAPGDVLRLGPPLGGRLGLESDRRTPLLLLAGGTGWAPLKALLEQVAAEGSRPVTLVLGARTGADLYDLRAIDKLSRELRWFDVTVALSHDHRPGAEHGTVTEVALRKGSWYDHDIYVCGPDQMVADAVAQLRGAGIAPEQLHIEDFEEVTA